MLRRMYDWVIRWAETPYGDWALFVIAFAESSFFPIPPDVLLIALGIAIPKKSLRYALLCSVGSVLGGCFGYLIGWQFMAGFGDKIINLYGFGDKYSYIQDLFMKYDAWAIGIAGFTPIPYKIFTIAAGAFKINFHNISYCLGDFTFCSFFYGRRSYLLFRSQDSGFYQQVLRYTCSDIYHSAGCGFCNSQIYFLNFNCILNNRRNDKQDILPDV